MCVTTNLLWCREQVLSKQGGSSNATRYSLNCAEMYRGYTETVYP
nr:MAG TPA: hypothetical protein [Caudoviricetes sp.]